MTERKPDFEDEKIRVWAPGPQDQERGEFKEDPTMMCLDVEHEEVFESRTYRFHASPEALQYLIGHIISQQPELRFYPEAVLQVTTKLLEDTTFKFLAKRRKEDGLITSLLIVVSDDDRCLLSRQERVEESEYRQAGHEFETCFLPPGVLTAPLIVTLEEWRRYSQEGPFSGK
jgi:hypothetical protein